MAFIQHTKNRIRTFITTIRKFHENWLVAISGRLTLLTNAVAFAIIGIYYRDLPQKVPLLYSMPWGEDRLAPPAALFLIPIGCLFWHAINIMMSSYMPHRYLIFVQMLFMTSLIFSILSLISIANIISLMT